MFASTIGAPLKVTPMLTKPGAVFKATVNDNVTIVDDSVIEVMTGKESSLSQ